MAASMRTFLLASLLVLSVFTLGVNADATNSGAQDFNKAGFPVMSLIAGLAFVALSIYYGIEHGGNDWRASASNLHMTFILLNLVNVVVAVFLLFGPDEVGSTSRSAVIGFQMLVGGAIGFYATYTNLKAVTQAFFVVGLFNVMALLGLLPIFGHTQSVYTTSQSNCIQYFLPNDPSNYNYNRCDDNGYLQLVRTFSMFAVSFLLMQLFQAFLILAPATPTGVHASEPLIADTYVAPTYNQAATSAPAVTPAAQEQKAGGYQQL